MYQAKVLQLSEKANMDEVVRDNYTHLSRKRTLPSHSPSHALTPALEHSW